MEINLLEKYPKTKRNLEKRSSEKTDKVRETARKFDKEFFDGDRKYGYGGFTYNPKYWVYNCSAARIFAFASTCMSNSLPKLNAQSFTFALGKKSDCALSFCFF